jgi:hypothetical protein
LWARVGMQGGTNMVLTVLLSGIRPTTIGWPDRLVALRQRTIRGSQRKRIDDRLIKVRDCRPLRIALLEGWGVRNVHAPENRYVGGLRFPNAKALEIAVSANRPILHRSQDPAFCRRLCRRRHWLHRLRVGAGNERQFTRHRSFRDGARERPDDPGVTAPQSHQAWVGRSTHRGQFGNGGVVPLSSDAKQASIRAWRLRACYSSNAN